MGAKNTDIIQKQKRIIKSHFYQILVSTPKKNTPISKISFFFNKTPPTFAG